MKELNFRYIYINLYFTHTIIEIQTQLSMYVHGTTRSKELIMLLHKFGIGIAYNDVLDLEAGWAVTDVKMVGFAIIFIF